MPGRLFLDSTGNRISDDLNLPGPVPTQTARFNIAPGQEVLTYTKSLGWTMMRWGLIPVGRKNARGRPVMETVVNARSETVFDKSAFDGVQRCIVPATGWYEWTGEKRRKTAWSLQRKDQRILAFAAIFDVWNGPGGMQVPQVATVTCAPNAQVAEIHHRMGVILDEDGIRAWLDADLDAAKDVMVALPDGALNIRQVTGVDWTAP